MIALLTIDGTSVEMLVDETAADYQPIPNRQYRIFVDGAKPTPTLPEQYVQENGWLITATHAIRQWVLGQYSAGEWTARQIHRKRDQLLQRLHDALANEAEPDFSGILSGPFPLAVRSWVNGLIDQATTAIQARALDSRVDTVVSAAQAHVADDTAHNLTAQLAAKSNTGHNHPVADVTGLSGVLSSLGSSYCTVSVAGGSHIAGRVAGTYFLPRGEALGITGTGTLYPPALIPLSSADYPTVGGVAPKLRIRVVLSTNDVAPTGNYTFGLHPVTRPATSGGAGLCIYTVGAAVAGSTVVINTPAADSLLSVASADFALPADGTYVIGVVTTGTVANSALVQVNAMLQIHNA